MVFVGHSAGLEAQIRDGERCGRETAVNPDQGWELFGR